MTAPAPALTGTEIGPLAWVFDGEDMGHLLAAIDAGTEVVFDLETTGLEEHAVTGHPLNGGVAARIVLASFTIPTADDPDGQPTTWLLPLSHPESPWRGRWREVYRTVAQRLLDAGHDLAAHNEVFDMRWTFAHTGVNLATLPLWDTQMSSHLLDENASTRLKERAPATFGVQRWDDFDLSYPGAAEEVPLIPLGEYAARDTYWTWRLKHDHQRRMFAGPYGEDAEPMGPEEVSEARLGDLMTLVAMPTVANIASMEQTGITMDTTWVRREFATYAAERDRLLAEMADRYEGIEGRPSAAATSHWFRSWTEKAVEADDLRIAAMTRGGNAQWSKGVLTRQARSGSAAARLVLDQRSAAKMAEYLESWLGYVDPRGVLHPRYHAGRVVTGRLSSSNPNAQQITRALKPAFVPRPGMLLVEIDYSQIELRVAAHVSGCEPMIEAFNRGDDLHTLLAQRITGKAHAADVTPEERQAGKSANFGLLYDMSAYGFQEYAETAYGVTLTADEAEEVHEAFFTMWDGMREWHLRQVARARNTGQVVSPIGRVRRLPDIFSYDEKLQRHAERNAINSPVQGFASDLMQVASAGIMGLHPMIEPVAGVTVVATVHDSIVVEVPEDAYSAYVRRCMDVMITGVLPVLERLGCSLSVPLAAEAKVGTRWGLGDVEVIT